MQHSTKQNNDSVNPPAAGATDNEKHPVEQIAEMVGGTITDGGILPDGSGFAVMSMPLPKTHWIYDKGPENFNVPPMVFRTGNSETIYVGKTADGRSSLTPNGVMSRRQCAELIREAGKYAIRASTMNGTEMDFDPDAMLQNLVVGFLGYWTEDGLAQEEDWANPPHLRKPALPAQPDKQEKTDV